MNRVPPHLPPIPPSALPAPDGHTVEVAAMLGDSVVSVKHLGKPDGGTVKRTTYALIGAGALLLILSAVSFAVALGKAHDNQVARQAWEASGKPMADYRPERLGLEHDWLAFGGAIGGIVCLTLGLVRRRRESTEPIYMIGQGAGVDFATDRVGSEPFAMVAPRGAGFVVRPPPGMAVEKFGPSGALPMDAAEVAVEIGSRYRIRDGERVFLIASVPAPRRHAQPLVSGWERPVVVAAGASLFGHLALIALIRTIAPDGLALADDGLASEGRLRQIRLTAFEEPAVELEQVGETEGGEGAAGAKMALTEGLMGKKDAEHDSGKFKMQKRSETQQLSRDQVMRNAGEAGILGLYSQRPQMFASLTGTGDFSSGTDEADIYGGLIGTEAREMAGGWGYGTRDLGPGGGGNQWGTVGGGTFGLIGHCGGGPSGCGDSGLWNGKRPGAGIRGRTPKGPVVAIGQPSSGGELDGNIIRRYIRRKLPAIRHCYERELMTHKDLSGTIVAQFQISPMGVVQGAAASGMGHQGVESCVKSAVQSIQFPRPKNGGLVNVRYPFVFHTPAS